MSLNCWHFIGASSWGESDEEEDAPSSQDQDLDLTPPQSMEDLLVVKEVEAARCFKNWRKMYETIKWNEYSEHSDAVLSDHFDIVEDLMKMDIEKVYTKLIKTDPMKTKYGWLPLMATCSNEGNIGALNAESYAERVISQASLVMTDGNTLLSDEETEWLLVLRMNRKFMEYMRANYSHLIANQCKMTTVTDD